MKNLKSIGKISFLFVAFILFVFYGELKAQGNTKYLSKDRIPFVGAQVFIEPGQSADDIDTWFRQLNAHNMTFCRIRMFESYMRDENYNWDFSLFDEAFKAADKYGIKVYATPFPFTQKTDIGGFKFPRNEDHLESVALFLKNLVTHFNKYESLFGWVIINEPGTGGKIPENELAEQKFEDWLKKNPPKDYTDNGYPVLVDFTRDRFLLDYNTWYLNWLAGEIKKYDKVHDIHVNSHAIFNNAAEYNFPEWRKFLTSFGGSAHPSWHFSDFERKKYSVAISANCEIIHSGAGSLPWFMTELQGGNNTYSGLNPFCPTKEEIAQWLWIITGAESEGTIFWSLNPRSSGIEAGEWALLDFQDNPSDRMTEAGKVAKVLQENNELFANSFQADSKISIIYSREALWAEEKMTPFGGYEARSSGGAMKSALGYFEALSETGVTPKLKALDEFDFSENDYKGESIILAHQISMPGKYADSLMHFVGNGGKLIIDGLTAFFDENMHNTMKTGFDYEKVFGGNVSEFKVVEDVFHLKIEEALIPAHLWKGFVVAGDGEVINDNAQQPVAIRNKHGAGEVLWVPSLLGLGSRIKNDYEPLQKLLMAELSDSFDLVPVHFASPQHNVLMRTLISNDKLVTILVNKNEEVRKIKLNFNRNAGIPTELYSSQTEGIQGETVTVLPEETRVIVWK